VDWRGSGKRVPRSKPSSQAKHERGAEMICWQTKLPCYLPNPQTPFQTTRPK
jgi:hypothetical protein